jgi:hypothetical protein
MEHKKQRERAIEGKKKRTLARVSRKKGSNDHKVNEA